MSKHLSVYNDKWLELTGKPARLAADAFPDAKPFEKSLFIPWTLDNSRRLTAMDLPSVSPIARDYDFPCYQFVDMPHQVRIADFICRNRRCYVFAGTGTGKSLSAAWAFDYLMGLGDVSRVLIICPLSIVNETWGDTLSRHFPHLSYSVLYGSAAKRRKLAANNHRIHIINFDGVESILAELQANKYDFVLIDESTAVKNNSTARWKSINAVVPDFAKLVLMTGTPIPQGPMDAYGQAKLMANRPLPKTSARWRDEVLMQVAPYIWKPRSEAMTKVKQVLSPAIYVDKRDVLHDLPPVTYTYRRVEMTASQKKLFEQIRKEQMAEVQGTRITAVNAAVKMSKLLQVAGGAVYDDDGNVVACDVAPRTKEMLDLIDQSLSKTIVFAPFRHVLDQIGAALKKHKIKFRVIHGGVGLSEREEIFSSFQKDDDFSVILAIPSAMSHGVTATAASTIVWFMPVSRNEVYSQACARIDRKGQRLPMTICHLTAHAIERQLYEAQQETLGYEKQVLSLYTRLLKEGLKDD